MNIQNRIYNFPPKPERNLCFYRQEHTALQYSLQASVYEKSGCRIPAYNRQPHNSKGTNQTILAICSKSVQ